MKKFSQFYAILIIALVFTAVANAQNSVIQLSNGIAVMVRTEISPQDSGKAFGNIYSSNSGNIIHRVLTDNTNKIYFGYDLIIEKIDNTGKFKVAIKPLSKKPDSMIGNSRTSLITGANKKSIATGSNSSKSSRRIIVGSSNYDDYTEKSLPNYPDSVNVDEGDTITLNLLENPSTNAKILDRIKINDRSDGFNIFSSDDRSSKDDPVKGFTLDDVIVRIEQPTIRIDEKEYTSRGTVAGNVGWVYIKDKGRFIFSIKQQAGYDFQAIGTILNNKISFEFEGEKYKFISKSPIVGLGGNWKLWVMHDPDYRVPNKRFSNEQLIIGAAGSVKTLFQE